MCGIAGALSFSNTFRVDHEYLEKMNNTMIHRGPNGGNVWVSDDQVLGLGHRRLSIIDLSETANQPMMTQDKRYVLTFNGEIYNHVEIREKLIALGHQDWQTTHSDTEVLLNAFVEWGIECVHQFRGMFAFAIWDNVLNELWLVRDRIGVKPLYYAYDKNKLVFASEIKAILSDPCQKRAVNEDAFFHYLSFLTTPAPMTLFEGIYKLEPGSWLKVSLSSENKITQKKYWDVWDYTQPLTDKSEQEIIQGIRQELSEAVKLRQVSDVPVGVFLSGGIDSSTNAALFSKNSTSAVKTFSIGYQGEYGSYQNELHFAKEMADFVNAEYHEKLLTVDDLLDFLPLMIKLQDEPIADPVCFPVYYVSKLARDNGVIVCQVGEGADELFWGYPTWKIKLNLQRINNIPGLKWLKRLGLYTLKQMNKEETLYYEMLRRGVEEVPIFWGGAEAFNEAQKQKLLSPRLKEKFKNRTSWEVIEPIWKRFQDKAWDKSILHWMSYIDLNFRLPELLLMRVDKMSMGVSLEGRVPFLDYKLVEYALSIPARLKTRHGQLKYLLKKAVRGLIPDKMIDRPKQGFGVPVYEWFFDKLGDKTREELIAFCKKTDFLDWNEVEKMLNQSQGSQVWYLLNFALWWKEYIEPYQQSNYQEVMVQDEQRIYS